MMRSVFGLPRHSGLAAGGLWIVIHASACQTLSGVGAKPPTVDECATADETAQALRKNGNLRAAKQQLAVCVNSACPAPVREDCADRATEVDKAMPTVLFDVKDSSGIGVTAVGVVMDDVALADHLDGTAFAVDPGKHRFTFTAANGVPVQKEVVVREGEKGQFVTAAFGPRAVGPEVAAGADAGAAHGPAPIGDDQKAAARLLGTEGVTMSLAGDCAGAVDRLARAEALVHAPTTALPLARCQLALGKVVAAIEILNRLVHETVLPDAPKSWLDARAQAPALLASAELRVAKLQIHVERTTDAGGAGIDIQLAVDGESVPSVLIDHDRPTDPGPHRVTAVAPGFALAGADVTLVDGQSQAVVLRLEPQPGSPAIAGAVPRPAQPPIGAESPATPNRLPAYVAFGAAGAAIVVGSAYGVLAFQAKSHLSSACSDLVCPTSSQGDINAYKSDPVISTVAWGVGLAAAAAGVYFWVSAGHPKPQSAAGFAVRPVLAPGAAGLVGTFQ
ncbi:MAG: hypothetical protein ABSF69_11080 [Polyangiaceae bacterium]|jgi:hypothetical protein